MMRQFDKSDGYMMLFIPRKQDVAVYKLFWGDKEHNDSTDIRINSISISINCAKQY